MRFVHCATFDEWRGTARRLMVAGVSPDQVQWSATETQPSLFEAEHPSGVTPVSERSRRSEQTPSVEGLPPTTTFTVPKAFLDIAKHVACHRDAIRWDLLYRTLWRVLHGERHLLRVTTDDDVYKLVQMQKAVTRDVHKMKAFVRFRRVEGLSGEENFVAWHRPDHRIVRLAAPFFSRRFQAMTWSILTPLESVAWDQRELHYGPGVPASEAPDGDTLEELWKTYYASIFNPARVKVAMMKREMPVRHWPTLPEASLIDELLEKAPERVETMIRQSEGFAETATHSISDLTDLASLKDAADSCRACELHRDATQTVFGEGPPDAKFVLVGEQPGDQEDIQGHPFVGPSGQLLNECLESAGIDRHEAYVTNVVKHFKFTVTSTSRGKHRLHKKPNSSEIYACRPWLESELAAVKPAAVVCLGATPAQALFGRDFRITKDRGKVRPTEWCPVTIATWHPAAILRMPDAGRRDQMKDQLINDLKLVADRTTDE